MTKHGRINRIWELGKWTISQAQSQNSWSAYHSPSTNKLYKKEPFHFEIHEAIAGDRRERVFERRPHDITNQLPFDAIPVTIIGNCIQTIRTEIGQSKFETEQPLLRDAQHIQTFDYYLASQPVWTSDLCSKWTSTEDLEELSRQLSDPNRLIQVATDGSVKLGIGCYGVALAGMDGNILFRNQGMIKNPFNPILVRRTETTGVLSALVIIRCLHEYLKIDNSPHGILTIWCDNMSTVNMVKKLESRELTTNEHGAPDIDVILQIKSEIQILLTYGYTTIINHIKAHQELPQDPNDPLFCAIALNKEADWLAGTAHLRNILPHDITTTYPAARLHVYCQHEQIHDGIHKKLRDVSNDENIITYLQERFKWKTNVFDTIWWSIHGKSLQKFPAISRLVIQKFNMDHWACNHREAVRGDAETRWCEICHHTEETSDHIIQCSHDKRESARNSLIEAIGSYMNKTGTPVAMKNSILQGIQAWLLNQPPPTLELIVQNPSPTLIQAYKTQNEIGWRHFLKGRISIHWSTLVNGELQDINNIQENETKTRTYNPESWGSGLLQVMWRHILIFWKIRNDAVAELYKQKGMSKEQFTLIRLATKELESGAVGYQHRAWMEKTPEDFKQMDVNSLKLWIRRIRNSKRTFLRTSMQGQTDLLCHMIGTLVLPTNDDTDNLTN